MTAAGRKRAGPSSRRWSQRVAETSDALDLTEDVFIHDDPATNSARCPTGRGAVEILARHSREDGNPWTLMFNSLEVQKSADRVNREGKLLQG